MKWYTGAPVPQVIAELDRRGIECDLIELAHEISEAERCSLNTAWSFLYYCPQGGPRVHGFLRRRAKQLLRQCEVRGVIMPQVGRMVPFAQDFFREQAREVEEFVAVEKALLQALEAAAPHQVGYPVLGWREQVLRNATQALSERPSEAGGQALEAARLEFEALRSHIAAHDHVAAHVSAAKHDYFAEEAIIQYLHTAGRPRD